MILHILNFTKFYNISPQVIYTKCLLFEHETYLCLKLLIHTFWVLMLWWILHCASIVLPSVWLMTSKLSLVSSFDYQTFSTCCAWFASFPFWDFYPLIINLENTDMSWIVVLCWSCKFRYILNVTCLFYHLCIECSKWKHLLLLLLIALSEKKLISYFSVFLYAQFFLLFPNPRWTTLPQPPFLNCTSVWWEVGNSWFSCLSDQLPEHHTAFSHCLLIHSCHISTFSHNE